MAGFVGELRRLGIEKLRRISDRGAMGPVTGVGCQVINTDFGTVIRVDRDPTITPPVKFGKATASWTSGNTIPLAPIVSSTDTTVTGEPNITANIFSPGGTPANVQISINNVVAYVTAPDGTYWVLNPNHGAFSSLGSLKNQVYQMTSTTTAGWQYILAHA